MSNGGRACANQTIINRGSHIKWRSHVDGHVCRGGTAVGIGYCDGVSSGSCRLRHWLTNCRITESGRRQPVEAVGRLPAIDVDMQLCLRLRACAYHIVIGKSHSGQHRSYIHGYRCGFDTTVGVGYGDGVGRCRSRRSNRIGNIGCS